MSHYSAILGDSNLITILKVIDLNEDLRWKILNIIIDDIIKEEQEEFRNEYLYNCCNHDIDYYDDSWYYDDGYYSD